MTFEKLEHDAFNALENARSNGYGFVFTNGVFDILHPGHVAYLTWLHDNFVRGTKKLLVVGINSDRSTTKLKGPGRPLHTLDQRIMVLEALSCVSIVIPFDEDTPYNLIAAVSPDVLAKGGDYFGQKIVGQDLVENNGGTVVFGPKLEGVSSTRCISAWKEKDGLQTDGSAAAL
jgi:D-beta-D-heptose 7-phosphate kinase/D-beta-D-heptose 1-phosphate adenosyltransferase